MPQYLKPTRTNLVTSRGQTSSRPYLRQCYWPMDHIPRFSLSVSPLLDVIHAPKSLRRVRRPRMGILVKMMHSKFPWSRILHGMLFDVVDRSIIHSSQICYLRMVVSGEVYHCMTCWESVEARMLTVEREIIPFLSSSPSIVAGSCPGPRGLLPA